MRPIVSCSTAILLGFVFCLTGCASKTRRVPQNYNPVADRAHYIERRATELIRRGVPKEQAAEKAAGEWFNLAVDADQAADAARRFEQDKVNNQLAKMEREKRGP